MSRLSNKLLKIFIFSAILIVLFATVAFAAEIKIEFYEGDKIDYDVGLNGALSVESGKEFELPKKEISSGTLYWHAVITNDKGVEEGIKYKAGDKAKLTQDTKFYQVIEQSGYWEIRAGTTMILPSDSNLPVGQTTCWYSNEGQGWSAGKKITFDMKTSIRKVTATDVSDEDAFKELIGAGTTMRLLSNLTFDASVWICDQKEHRIFMNGYTITFTDTQNKKYGYMLDSHRTALNLYGVGTIKSDLSNTFMCMRGHSYNGHLNKLFIGKNITIDMPNATIGLDYDQSFNSGGYPMVNIYGNVTAKTVVSVTHTNARTSTINIYDGALLNLNGPLTNLAGSNVAKINIYGGTINVNEGGVFFKDSLHAYRIEGGSFSFANANDFDTLKKKVNTNSYQIIEVNAKILTDNDSGEPVENEVKYHIVLAKNGCTHEISYVGRIDATCQEMCFEHYKCTKNGCEASAKIEHYKFAEHDKIYSYNKIPTADDRLGFELYNCKVCGSEIYEYDIYNPANDDIEIIVNGATKIVKVGQIFNLVETDKTVTIVGILAPDGYSIENITCVYVPNTISHINITEENKFVKTIVFNNGANVIVMDITKLRALETIDIKRATVDFKMYCAHATEECEHISADCSKSKNCTEASEKCTHTSLKQILSNTPGAKVIFREYSFTKLPNLTVFTTSSGSSYTFYKRCFEEAKIESLVFVDGSSVSFAGEQAFYNNSIKYLYVGKGITTINNKPFDTSKKMEKIILMDVTSIGKEYTFTNMNEASKPTIVYIHTKSLSLPNHTFRNCDGIIIYTTAEITNGNAFSECGKRTIGSQEYPAYQIHYGICHEYEEVEIKTDKPCLSPAGKTYVTTCPCGVSTSIIYKHFVSATTNTSNYTSVNIATIYEDLAPHTLTDIVDILYPNGYASTGIIVKRCSACQGNYEDESLVTEPLVICHGYSTTLNNNYGMMVRYTFNYDMIEELKRLDSKFEYGMVVASRDALGDATPLDASGNKNPNALKYSLAGYTGSEFKLYGIANYLETNFVMCAYIIDGATVYYIQESETVSNPSGISYDELASIVKLTSLDCIVPDNTKIYA